MADTATPGWLAIFGFAVAHNIIAAGRGRELLSQAARRHRRNHPVILPLAAAGLYLHLMGYLPRRADPLHWVGAAAKAVVQLAKTRRRTLHPLCVHHHHFAHI